MEESLSFATRLATASGPVLMALILVGSYFGVWEWTRTRRESEARCEKEKAEAKITVAEAKAEMREWKDMALRAVGVTETSVGQVEQLTRRQQK